MAQEIFDDVAFYYLMTALVAAIWIPLVYYKLKSVYRWLRPQAEEQSVEQSVDQPTSQSSSPKNKQPITTSTNQPIDQSVKNPVKQSLFSTSNILTVVLTIILILLINQTISHSTHDESAYASLDPYEVLGVSEDATVAQIKKAYRTLSFAYHPDKTTLDPLAAEKELLKIQKAYSSLTNSDAQANLDKYGNVDGYQGVSVSIGLPSFLTKKENAMRVMLLYVLCLFVLPPVAFLMWLKKSKTQAAAQAISQMPVGANGQPIDPATKKANKRAVNQANKEAMKKLLKQRIKSNDQPQSSD